MADTLVSPPVTKGRQSVEASAVPSRGLARQVVLKRLRNLSAGQLKLVDGGSEHVFGSMEAGGVEASVRINDANFYRRICYGGSLGAAESYMDGEWDCDDLTALLQLFVRQMPITFELDRGIGRVKRAAARLWHLVRANTRRGSRRNIRAHYDLGNDLFSLFLDPTMMYSSAVFEREDMTLHEASVAKLDRICTKLNLKPQDHVVEIGTGWGGFAVHAASQYGCRVTTTTISQQQYDLAVQRVREAGLEDRVSVLLKDYRDLEGQFDKLVSIEMIEAVGHRFFDTYFQKCSSLLKSSGMMLIQGITMPEQRYAAYLNSVDFIQRYIFPGGCLPSVMAMGRSIARRTDLRIVTLEDLAPHYARTLLEWRKTFFERIAAVRELGYPERFIRMWEYYLCYCEAAFMERAVGVVQLLAAKPDCRHDPVRGEAVATA